MTYTQQLEKLNRQAQEKIASHPELDRSDVWELCDWRNGDEQLEWFVNATVSEILETVVTLSIP